MTSLGSSRFPVLASIACAVSVAALPSVASAQAENCRMPRMSAPLPAKPDGPTRIMPIDNYIMSLIWSPQFCHDRKVSGWGKLQCSGKNGRFGLTVHGLWPNGKTSWPQWCPTRQQPNASTIAKQICITPSRRLLAHEWGKHGSCTSMNPDEFFRTTRMLYRSYHLPDLNRLAQKRIVIAANVREAFAAANPGWTPDMVGLALTRSGWLAELRLCYDKMLKPRRCTRSQWGPADRARVRIRPLD